MLRSKVSKLTGRPRRSSRRYSSQFTQRRTKSRSQSRSRIRTLAIASSSAASEPGQGASHQSAMDAVFDNRESMTHTFAPRSLASMIR